MLADHFEIEFAHQRQILEILLADARDRDIGDLDLIDPNQMEEQIERALEYGQAHRIRRKRLSGEQSGIGFGHRGGHGGPS